jgi:hypothetical protein
MAREGWTRERGGSGKEEEDQDNNNNGLNSNMVIGCCSYTDYHTNKYTVTFCAGMGSIGWCMFAARGG